MLLVELTVRLRVIVLVGVDAADREGMTCAKKWDAEGPLSGW